MAANGWHMTGLLALLASVRGCSSGRRWARLRPTPGAYAVNIPSSGAVGARALRRAITLVGERTGAFSGATVLEDLAPFSALAWNTRDSYDSGACLSWPNDPTATTPFPAGTVLADLPVLVLSGDLDATPRAPRGRRPPRSSRTPVGWEVKDAGHTPSLTPEGLQLIRAFIGQDR